MTRPDRVAPATCAQCGADIPRRALACPACGADERTGWREASVYDGLELPEEAWSDDTVSASRPSSARPARPGELPWYWWAAGLLLLLTLGLTVLGLR